MLVVSSCPPPLGITVAHTVVRLGIPPTESMPAIFQFALASRSAGSRLLSPWRMMLQLVGITTRLFADVLCVPFISQTTTDPSLMLRQRISLLPSPLKSAVPAMTQLLAIVAISGLDVIWVPFISQSASDPALELLHRISLCPCSLKSPIPAMIQLVGTWSKTGLAVTCVPSISQNATDSSVAFRQRMSLLPSPL